jgi:hypothetical protein
MIHRPGLLLRDVGSCSDNEVFISSLFNERWQILITVAKQVMELQQQIQYKDQEIANLIAANGLRITSATEPRLC